MGSQPKVEYEPYSFADDTQWTLGQLVTRKHTLEWQQCNSTPERQQRVAQELGYVVFEIGERAREEIMLEAQYTSTTA